MSGVLTMAGHQVPTSVANLLERQWRFNKWVLDYVVGCGGCPCDPSSVCDPDMVLLLDTDAEGHIIEDGIDFSCVAPSQKAPNFGCRIITINNKVRNCELNGCEGTSINEQKKIYLCHSQENEEEVRIYLQNNSEPVTHDEFGNVVPEYYVIGTGQLKWLCVVNGRITRIVN
jgi:hypothetical protein